MLSEKRFDILLTDHSLPGMSGVELARMVAARGNGVKIIFSSGYGAPVASGLDFKPALLPKPFTLAALQKVLEESTCEGST